MDAMTPLEAKRNVLTRRAATKLACWVGLVIGIVSLVGDAATGNGYWLLGILVPLSVFPFIYVLRHWALPVDSFFCPHCGKHVSKDTPWVCGFCDTVNKNTLESPLLERSVAASARPKPTPVI